MQKESREVSTSPVKMQRSTTPKKDKPDQQTLRKHPLFNNKYEITASLGHGKTSKVYLANEIGDPEKTVAIKIFREEYLLESEDNVHSIEQEIEILRGLNHDNIVGILDYGSEGLVLKPSGRKIKNLVYIVMQHVEGGIFFEVCEKMGAMGENAGRYFLSQMIDALEYMHKKGVVHRDLKLENILIDDKMNLKIVDFGFATYKTIKKLQSYKGTKTYMAPEIKKRHNYDGRQVDVFSTAVILFIIVNGIFPFKEATSSDIYYQLITQGQLEAYWSKVGVSKVSWEFKDLIIKMLSPHGRERPTFEQIREHPWMQKTINFEKSRQGLIDRYVEMRSKQSSESTTTGNNSNNNAEKKVINADDFKSPTREANPKLSQNPGCKTELTEGVNELIKQTEKMKIRI